MPTKKELEEQLSRSSEVIKGYEGIDQKLPVIEAGIAKINEILPVIEQILSKKVEIDGLVLKGNENAEKITTQVTDVDRLKEEVGTTSKTVLEKLGQVDAEYLSNSFGRTAKEYEISMKSWKKWVIWSGVVLTIFWLGLFSQNNLITDIFKSVGIDLYSVNTAAKAIFLSPAVLVFGFSIRYFGRDKKLYDEYKFKMTAAGSLESYRKVIGEECPPDNQSKKFDFILDTARNIYTSSTVLIGKDRNELETLNEIHQTTTEKN